jgi:PhzF family phenazine biosynthesis protein
MKLKLYQIDAFTSELFRGNPAAVCVLDEWLPESVMQQVAMENNLSETAFVVPESGGYRIRWFTPRAEGALCGHATLATAWVLFHECHFPEKTIRFLTMEKGELQVSLDEDWLTLDFPVDTLTAVPVQKNLEEAFSIRISEQFSGETDVLLVVKDEGVVKELQPDFRYLASMQQRGFVVTAPGTDCDFVSRCFYPALGIDEDPVTGSAHTTLVPYWAERLRKTGMKARQLSQRGGELRVHLSKDRVLISGQAVKYLEGEIHLL